ncbi:MAG: 4-hydroxy-tetrahydrodipicolinate reductase [Syntrophomonadaceae bacterium]|jgi:4-hydroxy-tetrahydrodipicolinate reductase|nr:4-hydroxy-tetrahydrodipicolinate reductase [Syntrophomonadaceae bacterium]
MAEKIKVIICGALGKMGRITTQAVYNDPELELVGLVDRNSRGESLAQIISGEIIPQALSLTVANDLEQLISQAPVHVIIDFTNPHSVFDNARAALQNNIAAVIGTSGLNDFELKQLEKVALENKVGIAVIPNFAIGAVLMMKFAQMAAEYFPDVEIIEYHHNQKIDAPSGTAIKTAEMIKEVRGMEMPELREEIEKIPGCRGGEHEKIRIHSLRLPGFIAHQEVIFGGMGQGLKIRHDQFERTGFMPGVLLAVKKTVNIKGLVYGMENLL